MPDNEDQQGETTQIQEASGALPDPEEDGQTTAPPLGNKSAVKDRIDQLRELKVRAMLGGGTEAIERQHARGKLSARERLELLLDPTSFVETDALARHRLGTVGLGKSRPYGDGVITG